jgi:hypothetical protein
MNADTRTYRLVRKRSRDREAAAAQGIERQSSSHEGYSPGESTDRDNGFALARSVQASPTECLVCSKVSPIRETCGSQPLVWLRRSFLLTWKH